MKSANHHQLLTPKMSEKFSLKWNDFHSNVSKSFILFRNEEYLHDVTLVSDDHSRVAAHKLVLSACSEYFRDIFKNNQDRSYLLLCLDGISSEDLKNIMDYMYNGEVQIYQENLDRFLAIAQRLKLEGLIGSDTDKEVEERDLKFVDDLKDAFKKDIIPDIPPRNDKTKIERSVGKAVVVANGENIHEIEEKVLEYLEESSDGSFKCTVCGKTSFGQKLSKSMQKQTIKRHIESHLEGLSYTCPICQKTLRSYNSFTKHRSRFHS